MSVNFFTPYQKASYPCYLLDNNGKLTQNAAADTADAPLSDKETIHKLLRGAKQEMAQSGQPHARTLPLLTEALRMRTLTLLPVPEGLFAVAVDEKEAPVSAFSAEMREPLSNIFATLPLLATRLEGTDLYLAEDIQQSCYSMLRLANNLENASRIEKRKYDLQVVDLSALVESLCFATDSVCKARNIKIDWEVPEVPLPVRANARLLSEALLNILRNSMQYTRDGNQITIKLARAGKQAVLTVEDNGLGIKPENLERIFEPYFSIDPYGDSNLRPGLGLGLSVVREAVFGFGGTVNAESRFGEGTRIYAALPLDFSTDELLGSTTADYLLNRYSPVYVHLSEYCRMPGL